VDWGGHAPEGARCWLVVADDGRVEHRVLLNFHYLARRQKRALDANDDLSGRS
jgi:hypothetical protein